MGLALTNSTWTRAPWVRRGRRPRRGRRRLASASCSHVVGREDVEEPRPGHLDLLDERRRRAARRRSPAPRRAGDGRPAWRARARRWWRSRRAPSAWGPAARASGRSPVDAQRRGRGSRRPLLEPVDAGAPRSRGVLSSDPRSARRRPAARDRTASSRSRPTPSAYPRATSSSWARAVRNTTGTVASSGSSRMRGTDLVAVEPGHHHIEHDRVRVQRVRPSRAPLHRGTRPRPVNPPSRKLTSSSRTITGSSSTSSTHGRIGVRHPPRIPVGPNAPSIVLPQAADGGGCRLPACRPRSSEDRAPASGAGSAGSNPAGGTVRRTIPDR